MASTIRAATFDSINRSIATENDLTVLAMAAGGGVSQRLGAILMLSGETGFRGAAVVEALRTRIKSVPRLRQQLKPVPGAAAARWVDDPHFDFAAHIRMQRCSAPGDSGSVLQLAAVLLAEPFAVSRPLWRVVIVSDLADGGAAVILIMHHMLADGVAGLAVLDLLLDPIIEGAPPVSMRADAVYTETGRVRKLLRAFRSVGGLHIEAMRCSLLSPSSAPEQPRHIATTSVALSDLRAGAHTCGATVNDALVSSVAGALDCLLVARGEQMVNLRIALPTSRRRHADSAHLGNDAGVVVVTAPSGPDRQTRLRATSIEIRELQRHSGQLSPAAALGGPFRMLAAMGLYRRYLNHQHRFHTIVSDLAGPVHRRHLAGSAIKSVIPLAVAELGNVTVSFVALSYAGTLTMTITADPNHCPDLDLLMSLLTVELQTISLFRAS